MEAIRSMPDDKEGTDYKATALHSAAELIETSFFNIIKISECICIGEDCEFFDKFLPHMQQDEQCLIAEHTGWAWGTDYPMSWGTIDTERIMDIHSELSKMITEQTAAELSSQVKSVDYILHLYDSVKSLDVKDNQVVVWYGVYEEPDDPWDC